MKYLYNKKTGKLHIKGFCCHTKGIQSDYKLFDSESEALAYDGRAVGLCKLCEKRRNDIGEKEKSL